MSGGQGGSNGNTSWLSMVNWTECSDFREGDELPMDNGPIDSSNDTPLSIPVDTRNVGKHAMILVRALR